MVELKCGCEVTEEGQFILGECCEKANCGECRMVAQMHPFGKKRLADLMLTLN